MNEGFVLLPGPEIKGSVNVTDLDIQVGMGNATVVSKRILEHFIVQKLVKAKVLIAEPYDTSLRKSEQPDPFVKTTVLSYGKHKVRIRFADLLKVEAGKAAAKAEKERMAFVAAQYKVLKDCRGRQCSGVRIDGSVKCKLGYGMAIMDTDCIFTHDSDDEFAIETLAELFLNKEFLYHASEQEAFITDWKAEDCSQIWVVDKHSYIETSSCEYFPRIVSNDAGVKTLYKEMIEKAAEKGLKLPNLSPEWMLHLFTIMEL